MEEFSVSLNQYSTFRRKSTAIWLLFLITGIIFRSQREDSGVTVTSTRPVAEMPALPSDASLRKDIPIPAKNLTAEVEEPMASVVKNDSVEAEIESKLLKLPPTFSVIRSEEDRISRRTANVCACTKTTRRYHL